jgi:hypothetical protein
MMRSRAVIVTAVLFVVGILIDVLTGAPGYFPGYAATIGLVGTFVLGVGSKWLAGLFIQAPEDYYPLDVPADDGVEDLRG